MSRLLSVRLFALLLVFLPFALPSEVVLAQEIDITEQADIIDVQQRLKDLGWYHGAVDGIAGPATRAAARAYRRAAGLPQKSYVDKELQLHLHFINPELRAGGTSAIQSDPEVRRAQELLKLLGYYQGAVDGISGPRTRNAVEAFRRDQGLSAGSRIDNQLLQELDNELKHRDQM